MEIPVWHVLDRGTNSFRLAKRRQRAGWLLPAHAGAAVWMMGRCRLGCPVMQVTGERGALSCLSGCDLSPSFTHWAANHAMIFMQGCMYSCRMLPQDDPKHIMIILLAIIGGVVREEHLTVDRENMPHIYKGDWALVLMLVKTVNFSYSSHHVHTGFGGIWWLALSTINSVLHSQKNIIKSPVEMLQQVAAGALCCHTHTPGFCIKVT